MSTNSWPKLKPTLVGKTHQGSNLKFHDEKNTVSDEVKDLLRSLLQDNPENRIDWVNFFNHPVFKQSEATTKKTKEGFMVSIFNSNNYGEVEKEFENNMMKSDEINRLPVPVNPNEMKIQKSAELVNVSIAISEGDSKNISASNASSAESKKNSFKEYSFRYLHEKNKIMMIYLTVKKLRQLMKEKEFAPYLTSLYFLINLLAKKGHTLSDLTLISLKNKKNIFNQPQFEEFCLSEEYADVIKQILDDQKSISEYKDYTLSLINNLQISEEEKELLPFIGQGYIDLKVLDEKAREMYRRVRAFDVQALTLPNDRPRHFYYLTMIFAEYTIKSEVHMPYKINNVKFEWDTFKEKHEGVDSNTLWEFLCQLTPEISHN